MTAIQPKKIDHIGIAVKDLASSIQFYTNILGLKFLGTEEVESEKVRVAFFEIGDSRIELLEATNLESPIAKFIEKKGEGIHHIAYQTENCQENLETLKDEGIKLINEVPKLGAHGSKVAFLHPKSTGNVLIELCQPSLKPTGKAVENE
jgi:methylmalonyl-CoA epimerase